MCAWNNTQRFIVRNVDHPKPDIFSFARTIAADGIEVPSGSATCLHLATTGSYLVLMKILVEEHNANVNAIDKQGSTPLHWACQKGNIEMIEYLIKHKAKVNTVDFDGWNALHYCVQGGHLKALKVLVEKYNMNIETLTRKGESVLSIACDEEEVEIIKYLCKKGANVKNMLNEKVECNQPKIVYYLAKYGQLSKNQYTNSNNPLHISVMFNYTKNMRILKKYLPWMVDCKNQAGKKPNDYSQLNLVFGAF